MSVAISEDEQPAGAARRALWRIGRGRSGGSLALSVFIYWAIREGRPVLSADGDPNNPTLARLYPPEGPHGVMRPENAELETSKLWLAETLASAIGKGASVAIDMGGGDRVSEELTAQADLGGFLQGNGFTPTFAYFTGPERDDFDHVYRVWASGTFMGGNSILFLNEGLYRSVSRSADPFAWLRKDPRLQKMEDKGVRPVVMPALTCMKYLEADDVTVFDVAEGRRKPNGTQVNPLWAHMTVKWLSDFRQNIEAEGVLGWLP